MAVVKVKVVNTSGQEVGLTLDEDGSTLPYLEQLVKRGELKSAGVVKPPAARKSASS